MKKIFKINQVNNKKNWFETKLGKLFKIKHGYAFKSEFFKKNGEFIVLTPGNFKEQGGLKIKNGKLKYYYGNFPREYILRVGDLLVVMTDLKQSAPILGSPAIISEEKKFLHNQRLGKVIDLNTNKIDKLYLYYLFNSPTVREQIKGSASGATVRHTSPDRIYNVKVKLPKIIYQKKIASILSAYDELIENNNRRIEILEEMAQTIYKEWFVHFRYPGHEKDKMVDSEIGKIPEGWEISDLGKIAKNKKESFVGQKHKELPLLDLARIPRKSLIVNNYGKYNEINTSRIIFEEEDILFGSIRPYFHKVIFAMKKGITNVSVLIIKPFNPNLIFPYLFWFLFDENTIKWATKQSGGTKMPVISWKILKRKKIIIPGNEILLKFNEIIFPIIHIIKALNRTNENLKKTRDILLPKLISGTIDVSDLDIKIEEKK